MIYIFAPVTFLPTPIALEQEKSNLAHQPCPFYVVSSRLIISSTIYIPSLSLHFPPPSMTPPFPSLYSAVIKVVVKNMFDVAKNEATTQMRAHGQKS